MKSYLRIERLILVGVRKNYEVKFENGLNIIHGDSDTGKSSILEFINYLLGSSKIELADEMISSVSYAALEVIINDTPYTIVRDIFKPLDYIEVYQCGFEKRESFISRKYAPNFSASSAPDGVFSDFLMDALDFPRLNLKVSPTQANSQFRRLSFRNIMKFTYVNQDDMGSKNLLGLGEWAKYTYTKEVFKYMYNVLDTDISDVEMLLSAKRAELQSLKKKYENVSEFLRETGYESIPSLDDAIEECDVLHDSISYELNSINASMLANSDSYKELKTYHSEFNLKLKVTLKSIDDLERKREQYLRLRNDYSNDIEKIKAIHLANKKIGLLKDVKCNCPVCDNLITLESTDGGYVKSKTEALDEELMSLIKREKSLEELIYSLSGEQKELLIAKAKLEVDLQKVSEMIDTETAGFVTPYLTQRDSLLKEMTSVSKKRESLVASLRVRNHQQDLLSKQNTISDNIATITDKLELLREKAPSIDGVLSYLADELLGFLTNVKIKNRKEIGISNKHFSPIVRGREYFNITSGGLRTIITIGHMSSILKSSVDNEVNHPRFLLLDTIGKYLGKNLKEKYAEHTDLRDDVQEGVSDPEKYENIYNSLIEICNYAEKKKCPCQIVVVDNDVPDSLSERLKTITVAHYSSKKDNDLPVGLIDDISYGDA
ncbi:exonuclease SbcC [Pantoea agglomerans]|uniref:AAA family ATPase n=1 Tax=Enterobacter agglomerans TaxID=549 RepID=UPI00077FF79D|nr:exonuclease SbcC [Pantoea agglomerans]KYN66482.1 exonuclease SbcC [Pantoea agglomerans]